jgi:hypothetical protein
MRMKMKMKMKISQQFPAVTPISAPVPDVGPGRLLSEFPSYEPSPQTSLSTPDPGLVNFYFGAQRLALQVDLGAAEFVEHHPRRFVPAQRELVLQQ